MELAGYLDRCLSIRLWQLAMLLSRLPRGAATLKRAYATVSDAAGVKVVGVETGPAATTSITVAVKAGTRYETQPGIAHALKSFSFKVGQYYGIDPG